jgi:hypothetical protein
VAAVAVVAGWAIFAATYFGAVIPQSVIAKSGTHADSGAVREKLAMVTTGLTSKQFFQLGRSSQSTATIIGMIFAGLAVYSLIRGVRARSVFAVIPAWFLVMWLFYVVGNPVAMWSWYTAPTALAAWWIGAQEGSALLARAFGRRKRSGVQGGDPDVRRRVEAAMIAVSVVAVVASLIVGVRKRQDSLVGSVVQLRDLAATVHRLAPHSQTIIVGDIGIIGWATNLRVVDSAGLVSPEASRKVGGQFLSIAALAQLTNADVIALRSDPAAGADTENAIPRRRLFGSPAERDRLLTEYRDYPAVDLGGYRSILIRRTLALP